MCVYGFSPACNLCNPFNESLPPGNFSRVKQSLLLIEFRRRQRKSWKREGRICIRGPQIKIKRVISGAASPAAVEVNKKRTSRAAYIIVINNIPVRRVIYVYPIKAGLSKKIKSVCSRSQTCFSMRSRIKLRMKTIHLWVMGLYFRKSAIMQICARYWKKGVNWLCLSNLFPALKGCSLKFDFFQLKL